MMEILLIGILVGLDNFAVASGLGMLGISRDRRYWFAISCACFEACAPVLGLMIGLELRGWLGPAFEWIGPVFLAVSGLLVLNALLRKQENPAILNRPLAMILFPLSLSLDNLTAGMGLGTSGTPLYIQAALVGTISGLMSVAGFAVGGTLRVHAAARSRVLAGSWLIACAGFSLLRDLI